MSRRLSSTHKSNQIPRNYFPRTTIQKKEVSKDSRENVASLNNKNAFNINSFRYKQKGETNRKFPFDLPELKTKVKKKNNLRPSSSIGLPGKPLLNINPKSSSKYNIKKINLPNSTNNPPQGAGFYKAIPKPQPTKPILTNGLINLGNTCYMNTIIQLLIHLDFFIKELQEAKDITKPLTCKFLNLFKQISKDRTPTSPRDFYSAFLKSHSNFSQFVQHDAIEFLRTFLDDLSKETNRVKDIPKYKEEDIQKSEQYDAFYRKRENSIIVDIFYGQYSTSFKCKNCGEESYSFEKFLEIPLIIKRKGNLKDYLKEYFLEEEVDWNSECKGCHLRNQKRMKKMRISMLPKVLIVSFQKLYFFEKGESNVSVQYYPEIDMSQFCEFGDERDKRATYELVCIINYYGTMDFGHYYEFIKIENFWYIFNDESMVTKVNISYNERSPYCLAFVRKDN